MSWALDEAPARETARAPAKRWRNWWVAPWSGALTDGREVCAGDFVPSPVAHPSRDVARTKAADYIADARRRGVPCLDYVDAFPEGERP